MKKTKPKINISAIIIEILYSLITIAWFIFPHLNFDNIPVSPIEIPGLNLNFLSLSFWQIPYLAYILYLVPIVSIYRIISLVLRKFIPFLFRTDRFLPILSNIFSTITILYLYISYIMTYATDLQFFISLDVKIYAIIFIAGIFNIYFLLNLIKYLELLNKDYQEYLQFQQRVEKEDYKELKDKEMKKEYKKKYKITFGIQTKLFIYFITIILLIISILSFLTLRDYRNTILSSVQYTGLTLTEQSANYIRERFTSLIDIKAYLTNVRKNNEKAQMKFQSLTYFKKQGKTDSYLVEASTNENEIGQELTDKEKLQYNELSSTEFLYNSTQKLYKFISPIIFGPIKIGYVIISYKENVIYAAYFKALIRIIFLTSIFIYIAIILIFLFGNRLILPLLFLRMNVSKIGWNLLQMVNGDLKKSASLLYFENKIKTRDEIRTLSIEFEEMVKVIKGVIPYISDSTLHQSAQEGEKSSRKDLTFLFTDVRGFTTMCEGMTPEEVVNILNRYLTIQTEIVMSNGGEIDKFVGDEIMAVFEGPNKELNACIASMKIRAAMQMENEKRTKTNLKTITIGIGINTGPVVFGNVGAKDRMDFTSIGDTVNLAARLEGANKEYNTKTLITEEVYHKVNNEFLCREIDKLTVKGKNKPVRIYEVLQEKNKAAKKLVEIKKYFEHGLRKYREKKWAEALAVFKKLVDEYTDGPSEVFSKRCKHFFKYPPTGEWNGVFGMKVK